MQWNRTVKMILTVCGLFLVTASTVWAEGFRDRLEGLVYEVEEWSEPKAWLTDKSVSDKWTLWTKEEDVINKRSMGAALHTPTLPIGKDRQKVEDGAPALHTKITGIPNGRYKVYSNPTNRPLAYSFDNGKNWSSSELKGEEFFGIFDIQDGTFEVWVDDRYATAESSPGWSYYDYIRFVPAGPLEKELSASAIKAFTLPDGTTQLSWTTSSPTTAACIQYGAGSQRNQTITEDEAGLRNHRVILTDLPKGKACSASVQIPLNRAGKTITKNITFRAGNKAVPGPSKSSKIRLTVTEPTGKIRQNWPVTSGIPFAEGILAGVRDLRLTDAKGTELPAQFETICTWPDGSVKWLICNFRADTRLDTPAIYYLKTGVTSSESKSGIDSLKISAKQQKQIDEILKSISSKVCLADGSVLEYKPGEFKTESCGAFCTTVRASGDYLKKEGEPGFRWRCDLSLFGDDFVRIHWFTGNNMLDKDMTLVKSIKLAFKTPANDRFTFSNGKTASKKAAVLQDLEENSAIELDGQKSNQKHFDGFVMSGSKSWFFRDFWQTWPKGLSCEKESVVFEILPELPKGYHPEKCDTVDELFQHYYWLKENAYQFKRGMEIRNDLWITTRKAADPADLAEHLAHPLFAVCDPQYYCQTGTFPPCNPVRKGEFEVYEKSFQKSFENLEIGRRTRGEYGWMNFGDWFGERIYNWGNNEYDGTYACFLHFIRSGNLSYFQRGIEMARHYSTVDFKTYPWDPKMRELMYLHCYAHVNCFFNEDDPRVQKVKGATKYPVFRWESDGSGGHAFQPGNFFAACLTGDRRFFEVAETACANQAKRYTPNFNFSIERAAGWPLINAVNAYLFTGNPYYLNAAELFFEVIESKQNKETGCFDLPQDQSECDCPDKKEHRGGKAFAVGILLHGLIRYYEVTKKPEVKNVIVRCSDWLLDYSWNEEKQGFRYKTGCPKYADSGWYAILVTEGIAFTGDVTGNKRYLDFLSRTLGPELERVSGTGRACGKEFSQRFRQIPHALYYLQKHDITNVPASKK